MKSHTKASGFVEQWLRLRPRHFALEVAVDLRFLFHVPMGKEARQRRLGKHDEPAVVTVCLPQQRDQTLHGFATRNGAWDRTKLGRRDFQ